MANVGRRTVQRGVLNITSPKWAQSVSYHMATENSTLFSLNIGDSLTNNAWGKGRREGGSKEGWGKEGRHKRRVGGGRGGRREGGGGREGARGWWGERERGRERRKESQGREVGSDDARQTESVSGGREG